MLAQSVEGKYCSQANNNDYKTNIGIGNSAGNTRRCGQCRVVKQLEDFDRNLRGEWRLSCRSCLGSQ